VVSRSGASKVQGDPVFASPAQVQRHRKRPSTVSEHHCGLRKMKACLSLVACLGVLSLSSCSSLDVWTIERLNGLDRNYKIVKVHDVIAEVPRDWARKQDTTYGP
jgi:hypothetical protein